METLRLALDWTPNVNHTGFFVALDHGFYRDLHLDVHISTPADDNYLHTPAKKLELGLADLAICPTESIIAYRTKVQPFAVKAVAALLQNDLSALCSLQSSGIHRPKLANGKVYASYNARYEDGIVREVLRADGATGECVMVYPDKLGIWNTLLEGRADLTWIFLNWEGIEAEGRGIKLYTFKLEDYGIPYSYSPVLISSEELLANKSDSLRRFLWATREGFMLAQHNCDLAAKSLLSRLSDTDRINFNIHKAQEFTNEHYTLNGAWGTMDEGRVNKFMNWLIQQRLELRSFKANDLIDNSFLA